MWPSVLQARQALRRTGFDLVRFPPAAPSLDLGKLLNLHRIDLVVDVGANVGQFAQKVRGSGYARRIISVEPLAAAFAELELLAARDAEWQAVNVALGDRVGTASINVAGNSASSSLLPMSGQHVAAAPHSAYVGNEQVKVETLDNLIAGYAPGQKRPLIKIDSQGYEGPVLDGGSTTLRYAQGVLIEMSLVALYEGQLLFSEVLNRLLGLGFELWGVDPVFHEPISGRQLQVDGWFFRP